MWGSGRADSDAFGISIGRTFWSLLDGNVEALSICMYIHESGVHGAYVSPHICSVRSKCEIERPTPVADVRKAQRNQMEILTDINCLANHAIGRKHRVQSQKGRDCISRGVSNRSEKASYLRERGEKPAWDSIACLDSFEQLT